MIKLVNDRTTENQTLQYDFDGNEWCQKWEKKFDASELVMTNQFQEDYEPIRQQVLAGKLSPLAYHIQVNLFSVKLLSLYTEIPKRHIKKHLKPKYFNQLEEETLKKYAAVFEISVEELKKV